MVHEAAVVLHKACHDQQFLRTSGHIIETTHANEQFSLTQNIYIAALVNFQRTNASPRMDS